jgi:hypothetical protein
MIGDTVTLDRGLGPALVQRPAFEEIKAIKISGVDVTCCQKRQQATRRLRAHEVTPQ